MARPAPEPRDDDPIEVEVVREGRLRSRIHWEWRGNRVLVRAPRGIGQPELDRHVAEIVAEVKRRRARVRARADSDLEAMARRINADCFGGEIEWHSIRWVGNMQKRLGSCTNGGPTDGDIRISERIRGWPEWVVAYVVAHELAHRKYSNHGPEFWALLGRYPRSERARGFIQGVAFQLGEDAEDWL
ncbi:MAG: M48 family metallopeptidase [Anaerolineaceae bacterium]|nr:M48 family metallopeptidase [Anaerolineaceae bacterium]